MNIRLMWAGRVLLKQISRLSSFSLSSNGERKEALHSAHKQYWFWARLNIAHTKIASISGYSIGGQNLWIFCTMRSCVSFYYIFFSSFAGLFIIWEAMICERALAQCPASPEESQLLADRLLPLLLHLMDERFSCERTRVKGRKKKQWWWKMKMKRRRRSGRAHNVTQHTLTDTNKNRLTKKMS